MRCVHDCANNDTGFFVKKEALFCWKIKSCESVCRYSTGKDFYKQNSHVNLSKQVNNYIKRKLA